VYQSIINFSVPDNVAMGYYFYDVKVQYSEMSSDAAGPSTVYVQTAGDLQVGTPEHSQCDRLYAQLAAELNRVNDVGEEEFLRTGRYPDYLVKANEEFYRARILYRDEDFTAALPHLQAARTILGEQTKSTMGHNQLGPLVLLILLPAAAAILVSSLILYSRKRRKKANSKD
jgi:hypothetical protein